jgi:endonuclease YncB( thermonuclease family)
MVRASPKMPFSNALAGRRKLSTRTLTILVLLLVAAAGAGSLIIQPPLRVSATLSGRPFVVDGDTLDFRNPAARVRIVGIDAPELSQTCRDAGGADWPCGEIALVALNGIVADGVRCSGNDMDRYRRYLVTCTSAKGDVGSAMVLAGMAIASGRYGEEERLARASKTGLWVGEFEDPRAFRQRAEGFDLWGWIMSFFGR